MQASLEVISINLECPDCGEMVQMCIEDVLEDGLPECEECGEIMEAIDCELDDAAIIS
ncbi:MAG: hypothetical protein ACFFG0_24450 [Candidatus Thorarchaeota archaeon]